MDYARKQYPKELRLQVAIFAKTLCQTSTLTQKMFICCRGLPVLVEFLDKNYFTKRELCWMAVDSIASVIDLQVFLFLFIKNLKMREMGQSKKILTLYCFS